VFDVTNLGVIMVTRLYSLVIDIMSGLLPCCQLLIVYFLQKGVQLPVYPSAILPKHMAVPDQNICLLYSRLNNWFSKVVRFALHYVATSHGHILRQPQLDTVSQL